jgi:hypothetical protein
LVKYTNKSESKDLLKIFQYKTALNMHGFLQYPCKKYDFLKKKMKKKLETIIKAPTDQLKLSNNGLELNGELKVRVTDVTA